MLEQLPEGLVTPALVVDADVLDRNIARMAEAARTGGFALLLQPLPVRAADRAAALADGRRAVRAHQSVVRHALALLAPSSAVYITLRGTQPFPFHCARFRGKRRGSPYPALCSAG